MSETTSAAPETVSAPSTPAKPKAKRVAKPKAKAKPSANGRAKAKGEKRLTKMQIRMLKLLAKKARANRPQLTIAACDGRDGATMDGSHLGNQDPKARKVAEKKSGRPSLLTLGYVRQVEIPKPDSETGAMETWYEITAAGRKALKNL